MNPLYEGVEDVVGDYDVEDDGSNCYECSLGYHTACEHADEPELGWWYCCCGKGIHR